MGYLIKPTLVLKKIIKVFTPAEIIDLANNNYLIDTIDSNIKIVNIKFTCTNGAISGYNALDIIDDNSGLLVARMGITSMADNYNYFALIGYDNATQVSGYNFKQFNTGISLRALSTPFNSATSLIIEITYFE